MESAAFPAKLLDHTCSDNIYIYIYTVKPPYSERPWDRTKAFTIGRCSLYGGYHDVASTCTNHVIQIPADSC